jgi:TolB-like protein/DNA-binding winged helix-turn-helix (wHTH) protein/tetratricopeptide (TPR) repeat protein
VAKLAFGERNRNRSNADFSRSVTDPRLTSGVQRASQHGAYIDLGREADFALGQANVRPSSGGVEVEGRTIRLQPRVMQVLVALAHANGEVVSRDQLVARCWGGLAVGDDAINRCIGQLRRLADIDAPGAFEIVTLARIGYRLVPGGRPSRLPPGSHIGAKAETTGALDERPLEAQSPVSTLHRHRAALRWLSASAAALAILIAALVVFVPSYSPTTPPMFSVAVLPIRNLTGDPSLDSAADKLTEDVAQVLGRGGYLYVAPRDASFAWKDRTMDDHAIGRDLHVRHIVTGSLRKSGNSYRVSYELVDSASNRTVDSQDIGSTAPGGALPENALAMTLYAEVVSVIHRRWSEDELAKPADDRDPDNILARLENLEAAGGRTSVNAVNHLFELEDAAISRNRALTLVFEINRCSYYANRIDRRDYATTAQRDEWGDIALASAEKAEAFAPHATSPHSCRADVYRALGRWNDGLAEANYIIANYPLTATGYQKRAELELDRGDFSAALRDFTELSQRTGELCEQDGGEAGGCHGMLGLVYLFLGENDAAIAELQKQQANDPNETFVPFFLSAALEASGSDHALPQTQDRRLALETARTERGAGVPRQGARGARRTSCSRPGRTCRTPCRRSAAIAAGCARRSKIASSHSTSGMNSSVARLRAAKPKRTSRRDHRIPSTLYQFTKEDPRRAYAARRTAITRPRDLVLTCSSMPARSCR